MRSLLLTALELVFVAALLVGIAFAFAWWWSLIVGGIIGVAACEAAEGRVAGEQARPLGGPRGVPTDREPRGGRAG